MTHKRIRVVQQLLDFIGLEKERLRLEWISAAEGQKFAEIMTAFTQEIRALGPSRLAQKIGA
jgi:coenzyme F420-reducing hydrogenase delta subunit